jgi:hypothetical protein
VTKSLPRGVTNGRDIPFQVIHRVIVVGFGPPEEGLRLLPRPQPEHLLRLRRSDRARPIRSGSDRFQCRTRPEALVAEAEAADVATIHPHTACSRRFKTA